jgi:hypothetical protein
MNTNTRAQIAASLGIVVLAFITVAPWVAESHWLKPQEARWRAIIRHKDDLVIQMLALDKEVTSYQNIPEKKEANQSFRRNVDSSTLDGLQGFVSSNPKYQVFNFKTSQAADSKVVKVSLVTSYDQLGHLLTDMWNNYQFLELDSMIMKPNPNRPDDEVLASALVKLP